MDNNKRYDFKDGATGCLVGVVISAAVTIIFSLVFTKRDKGSGLMAWSRRYDSQSLRSAQRTLNLSSRNEERVPL